MRSVNSMTAEIALPVSIPTYPFSMPVSSQSFDLGGGGSGVFRCSVSTDPPEVVTAYFQLHLGPPDHRDQSAVAVWCFPAPEGALYGGQMLEVRPSGQNGPPEPGGRPGVRTVIHVSLVAFPGPHGAKGKNEA